MSPGTGRRAAAIIAIACTGACLGAYSRALDETRAGLLGLDGRDLRACLGVPTDFAIDGDVEQQTYRFDHDDEFEELHRHDDIGGSVLGGRGPYDHRYEPGGFPPRDEPD